jgi:transglutaminase-like putative cysteine protease
MARPDPTMVPTERLAWTGGVVLGASLPHWPQLPLWIPFLLIACIAWRFAAKFGRVPMPGAWLRIVLAIIAFLGVLFSYRTINGVSAGSALLVVMVALKFFECHTQRDQMVLMIISYFLVFASLLYGGSILTGLYLIGFVWVTTVGLLQLGRGGVLLPSWPTAKYCARLLLQSVPIMVVLFLLFPRLPGPLWGIPGSTSSGASGLSGEMSPGDITDLGLSDEVAFRAEFFDGPPAPSDLYWRGPVLTNFNGRTWSRDRGMRGDARATLTHFGASSQYRVTLEPSRQPWLFALEMPEAWSSLNRRRTIVMGSDYQLQSFAGDGRAGLFEYQVTSHSRYSAKEELTERQLEVFRRLPEGSNPRTRELAQSWLADSPSPRTTIDRALEFFRGEEFFYTLTPPALGTHTADEFLFETREGFCEHYASAFTIMLRSAGLPARVVTGYQGGELNPLAEYYIVRQSDAHAWTEVWLEDEGWVRIDPITTVAPERIALGSVSSVLGRQTSGAALRRMALTRQLLLAWDTANTYWDRWVIGYTFQLQRSLLERMGFDRPRVEDLLLATVVAMIALMSGLSIYLTLRFRKERHRDPAAGYFARFIRRLHRYRVDPIRPGEAPTQYAERAVAVLPSSASEINAIVRAYLAARYEPTVDNRAIDRLAELVTSFSPKRAPASS